MLNDGVSFEDTSASYYQQMYPSGGNANGPTIIKYTAYMEPLKTLTARYCQNYRQVEALNEMVQAPPQRVEMRHKKDQDKAYYQLLDAFKTVKPAEKDSIKPPSRLDNVHRGSDEPKKQPSAKTLKK